MGQQWNATGVRALGAVDLGMAQALLEEVTITPPESRQNLHRTEKTELGGGHKQSLCVPGPKRKKQWPQKRLTQTCP